MLTKVVFLLALCAVCITAQQERQRSSSSRREELVAVDMDLMRSDYESLTSVGAHALSQEVESMMEGTGLRLGQVEVGPSDPPPQHRARRWRVTIRIRIWIFTIEINIGRKKRSVESLIEMMKKALAGRDNIIGGYLVDPSSVVLEDPTMYRGTSTMDIPLQDLPYSEKMADETSREYQSIAEPILGLMGQRQCFLARCQPRITIIYCYPHVHVIVVHCHHYHLWWLRNRIMRIGSVGGYRVNTGAMSISNE